MFFKDKYVQLTCRSKIKIESIDSVSCVEDRDGNVYLEIILNTGKVITIIDDPQENYERIMEVL